MPPTLLWRRIFAWLVLYVMLSGIFFAGFTALAVVNTIFHNEFLEKASVALYFTTLLILIGIGIVSLLPISGYTYIRQTALNPAVTREILREEKKGRNGKEFGILLGIVGITIIAGLNPWNAFFLLSPSVDIALVTLLMVAILAVLVIVYMKLLRQYIKFSPQPEELTPD